MDKKIDRIYYLDVLRIISIFGVILIHDTASNVANLTHIGSESWWVANILNASFRWAVPIFFMISGALLANKEESLKDLFGKRILKILIPFLCWSVIYSFLKHYYFAPDYPSYFQMPGILLNEIVFDKVYVHFWFIYVLLGIYLILPFIQAIIKNIDKQKIEYFLGSWFILTVFYKLIQFIYHYNTKTYLYIPIFDIPFFNGYIGYFILGYYLKTYDVNVVFRRVIYLFSLIALVATPTITYYLSVGQETLNESLYINFSLTNFFISVGIFLFFKNINVEKRINHKMARLITSISNSIFGIYFIHLLIQLWFNSTINTHLYDNWYYVLTVYILSAIVTFMFSYLVIKIIAVSAKAKKLLVG